MLDKITTAIGEVWVTVINHKRVKFENDPEFNGGNKALPCNVNGVPVKLSVTVSIDDEGVVLICENQYDSGVGIDDARLITKIDVRRADRGRRYRPVKASIPARKRIIGLVVPQFIEVVRKLMVERAVIGVKVLRTQAGAHRSQAESYRVNAIKQEVEAAHCEAVADALEASHAWAIEHVPEARPEQKSI